MSKILCITTGLTGILHASFEVASRLIDDGHRVILASPRDVREKVVAQGFEYLQLPPIAFSPAPTLPRSPGLISKIRRLWTKAVSVKQRQLLALANLKMTEFSQILDEQKPDFLLIDVELHDHIMTAFAKGFPMALLSQWFSLWKCRGLPPLAHSTIPGRGWHGHWLSLELAWQFIRIKRQWNTWKKAIASVYSDRRSILRCYAKKVGFPLQLADENYWPGPFTYNSIPVLSTTLFEMEFPHQPPPFLKYVGAMVYADRKDEKTTPEQPGQFEAIFQRKQKTGAALIYCSVSTFSSGDVSFLRKIIQAVNNRPDWLLILSVGGLLDVTSLGPLPENIRAFTWVPQLLVLKHADCSINHGGIHTINECIHFKVPMLVYSGKKSDQNGCAARGAFHNLGMMADKDKDDVPTIRERIEKVLTNNQYRHRMTRMHQHYQDYKSQNRIAKVVNQLMMDKQAVQTDSCTS